jgi:regulatory protein
MDLLARREHGREELAGKLKRRFAKREMPPGLLESTLDALEQEGLLSDTRFAESALRQLLGKGVGPLRLRQELTQRQLSPEARAHIQPSIDAVDWFAQAEAVYARKFGDTTACLENFDALQRERGRRGRFMQYRGFRLEHFQHLLEGLSITAGDKMNGSDDDL